MYSTVWNAPFDPQVDVKAPSLGRPLGVLGERLRPGLRALGDGQRLDERWRSRCGARTAAGGSSGTSRVDVMADEGRAWDPAQLARTCEDMLLDQAATYCVQAARETTAGWL